MTSDALWPMPGPQRFAFIASPQLPAPRRFGVSLVSTFQKRPIVLRVPTPGPSSSSSSDVSAIDNQLEATLVTAYGILPRLSAYLALPTTLYETGAGSAPLTGRAPPASSSLRDPRVGAAFAIVPDAITAFTDVQVPTGSTTDFAGEKGVVISPSIAGELRLLDRIVLGAMAGVRARPVVASFVGERQGTQALVGAGSSVDVLSRGRLSVGVEARAILGIDARSSVQQTPTGMNIGGAHSVFGGEWLGSVRTAILSNDVTLLAGGGGSLPLDGLVGIGVYRILLGLAYTPAEATKRTAGSSPTPPAASTATPSDATPPKKSPVIAPAASVTPSRANACVVECRADSYSPMPKSDEVALADRFTPVMTDLHTCLSRAGAGRVMPVLLLRFTDNGKLTNTIVDLGGYDAPTCMQEARAHLPDVTASRGTTLRCELRCP